MEAYENGKSKKNNQKIMQNDEKCGKMTLFSYYIMCFSIFQQLQLDEQLGMGTV